MFKAKLKKPTEGGVSEETTQGPMSQSPTSQSPTSQLSKDELAAELETVASAIRALPHDVILTLRFDAEFSVPSPFAEAVGVEHRSLGRWSRTNHDREAATFKDERFDSEWSQEDVGKLKEIAERAWNMVAREQGEVQFLEEWLTLTESVEEGVAERSTRRLDTARMALAAARAKYCRSEEMAKLQELEREATVAVRRLQSFQIGRSIPPTLSFAVQDYSPREEAAPTAVSTEAFEAALGRAELTALEDLAVRYARELKVYAEELAKEDTPHNLRMLQSCTKGLGLTLEKLGRLRAKSSPQ